MAPPAPTPTFDTQGNLVAGWGVRLDYSPTLDQVTLYWHQAEGAYHQSGRGLEVFAPQDVEDAVSALQRRTRILAARRLF